MTLHVASESYRALPQVGDTLDERFELQAVIGEGGMGYVFRAYDRQAAREVALKLITPRYLGRPEREERFFREAELGRRARHEHLAEYLDSGRLRFEEWPFLSMQIVQGKDLGFRLARGALPPRLAARAARQIAGALRALHRAGVVHRDVTPLNVLMHGDEAVLIDLSHAGDMGAPQVTVGEVGRLTQPHEVPGTHYYMPREQAQAAPAHPAMDVYALGVTLVHMLTGRAPSGCDRSTFIALQREGKLAPPRVDVRIHSAVPPKLADLAHACIALEIAARPSIDEVVERLDELLAELSMPAEPTIDLAAFVRPHRRTSRPPRKRPQAQEIRPLPSPPSSAPIVDAAALDSEPSSRMRGWAALGLFVLVMLFVGGWALWPRGERAETSPAGAGLRQGDRPEPPAPSPKTHEGADALPAEPSPEPPSVMAATGGETDGPQPPDVPELEEVATSKRPSKRPGKRKPPPSGEDRAPPAASASDECVQTRERADEAFSRYEWGRVVALASHSKCWSDHTARRRILVRALFHEDRWAECIRAGGDSKDAEVKRWVDLCKRQTD